MLPRTIRPTVLVAVAVCFVSASATASAQLAMCGARAVIVDQLKMKYQESRQAVGLISGNGAAELYVSEKGTWTMLITLTSGKSCIIAAGHDWDVSPSLTPGTGI